MNKMNEKEFLERWNPWTPYAANEKNEYKKTIREEATKKIFIQNSAKQMRNLLVLDIDNESRVLNTVEKKIDKLVYANGNLPEPNFTTYNPKTGGAHMGYFIDGFVSTPKGIDFFKDIHKGLTIVGGADPGYVNFGMRNPLHEDHIVHWGTTDLYSLTELREYLPQKPSVPLLSDEELTGGRNTDTFNSLRRWAYRNVLKYKSSTKNEWYEALLQQAKILNQEYKDSDKGKMSYAEVSKIAKSVCSWSQWDSFTPETFSKIQTARVNKRWKKSEEERNNKKAEIMAYYAAGFKPKEIANSLDMSYDAVRKMIQRMK